MSHPNSVRIWFTRLALLWPAVAVALVVSSAFAAPRPRLIAVVNRAEWCSVCKANGPRAGKALMSANEDGAIAVVMNDLTNAETAKASSAALRAAGVEAAMAPYTATGVIYLFDATSRKPLAQITVANSDDEIRMAIAMARKRATP